MSETTQATVATTDVHGKDIRGQGLCGLERDLRARARHHPAPRARAAGRAARRALLRRLPLGPAPGAERMAGHHADRLPLRAGPRDRRPRGEGGRRRSGSSRKATWRRWAAWWTRAARAPRAGKGRSSSARARRPSPTTRPTSTSGGVTYGGYSDEPRRRRGLRAAGLGPARPGGRGAAAVRRHHHLFAAAPLERRQGTEGRRGGPRRAGAHGREVRQRVRRPRRRVHDVARQGGGRGPARRARRRRLQERRRDAEARWAASTSSWTRSRPCTT